MINLNSEKIEKIRYQPVLGHYSGHFKNNLSIDKYIFKKIQNCARPKISVIDKIYANGSPVPYKKQMVIQPSERIHILAINSPILGESNSKKIRSLSVISKRKEKITAFNKFEELALPVLCKYKTQKP